MAKRVVEILIDDLTGEESDKVETVAFGVDGSNYEIELNAKNAEKLRKALEPFVANGRKVGRRTGAAGKRTELGAPAKLVREWAKGKGIEVPDRGRIPQEVRDQYEKEN